MMETVKHARPIAFVKERRFSRKTEGRMVKSSKKEK